MGQMLIGLASTSVPLLLAVLVAVQLLAKEVGFAVGRRRVADRAVKDDSINVVSTSIYGLLAFALAFNLSMASSYFNERRMAVLNEANSIGTLWLQATAVNHVRGQAIAGLAKEYITLRRQEVAEDWGSEAIAQTGTRIGEIQTEMWGHIIGLTRDRVDPQVAQLEGSMNAAFDSTTAAQFAIGRSIPPKVVWLLLGLSVVAMTVMGYQFAMYGHPHRTLGLTIILVWTAVQIVILDLGSARVGDIRVDTSAYDMNIGAMTPIPVPPLPN